MKWILWIGVFLISNACMACPETDCVRIGSWNIEWLGSSKRQQPVDTKTIEHIATQIAEDWSIDLITLQEINTDMNGEYRGEHYSLLPWQRLQKALEQRGYKTASGQSGYAQHIVMAWRKPVTALELPRDLVVSDKFVINEFCRSANLRKPLGGLFEAGHFDFWLVGLHLKANTGPAACTTAVRGAQARELSVKLKTLESRDADIILAGDFNASSQHTSLETLRQAGFISLTERKQRHNDSNSVTHHGKNTKKSNSGSLLDQFMIRPTPTREWQLNSTMILKPEDPHRFANTYSDHLPLWTDFTTSHDDD